MMGNLTECERFLCGVIVLMWAYQGLRWLQSRSVRAKREAAAKLQRDAFYQENMEAAALQNAELADDHWKRLRRDLGIEGI